MVSVFSFLFAQITLSANANILHQLSTPLSSEYTTDMRGFLKTYQLMKLGQNFYPAFYQGMAGLRSGNFHPDINAWRQPFIFYLWKALPGDGKSIYFLWQAFLIAILISSYLITRNLLSPLLLWPYLHYSLVDLTILQPEWWGMAFLVFGLAALIRNKYFLSGILFALSVACREPFMIPVLGFIIYKRKACLTIPLVFLAFYYFFYHLPHIMSFGTEWFRNYTNGNWRTLHSIFAYASWEYPFGVYRPFVIIFFLAIISFLFQRKKILLLLSFFPFFIFAATMATLGKIDATRDYWSIYFIPLLLIVSPVLILPSEK